MDAKPAPSGPNGSRPSSALIAPAFRSSPRDAPGCGDLQRPGSGFAGRLSEVACEWMEMPRVARDRVFLFLHGGSYNSGSPRTHRVLTAHLSRACHMRVLVPEMLPRDWGWLLYARKGVDTAHPQELVKIGKHLDIDHHDILVI